MPWNSVARVARTAVACKELVSDAKYLQQALFLPYHKAYWHVLAHRQAVSRQLGPLDLRASCCKPLFACYLCDVKGICWESIRQRWALCNEQLGSEAVVALQILLEQPTSRVRAKGLKACDRWLRQHGLPGSKKVKIRWPSVLPRNVFKACLIPSCY